MKNLLAAAVCILVACGEPAAPPSAAKLAFKISPASVLAGSALPAIEVDVQDASGAVFATGVHQVSLELVTATGAALLGTTTAASANGVATFSDLKILKAGTGYTIKATATGLTEATSSTFSIVPGPITRIAFQVPPSNVIAGASMTPAIAVAAYDTLDNLATNLSATVTLSFVANPGGSAGTGLQANLANGVATFSSFSLNKAGTGYALKATYGTGVAATSGAFDVSPAAASALAITAFPTAIEVGVTLTPVVVAIRDQFDNTVTTSTAPVTLDGAAFFQAFAGLPVLTGTTTVNAINGVATFSNVSFDRYGSVAIRASSTGLASNQKPTAVTVTFSALDADTTHACGISVSGSAFCWGNVAVGNGASGIQSNPQLVSGGRVYKAIATGAEHTCALTTAGVAYCWGNGGNSQIGDGSQLARSTPVAVSTAATFTTIAAGWWHTCGITTSGTTLCWGYNPNSQLGDSSTTDRTTPVTVSGGLTFTKLAAGRYHTCGLTAAGAAYCWGSNESGQVGDNGPASDRPAPVAVAGGLTFKSISANGRGTCGVTSAGAAYCWGLNDAGQVGDSSEINRAAPTPVTGGLTFKSVSTSGNHVCAISDVDDVWCWGSNAVAQGAGSGKTSTPLRIAGPGDWSFSTIVAGDRNTFGIGHSTIIPNTAVCTYSWGLNAVGQLGRNSLVTTMGAGCVTSQ